MLNAPIEAAAGKVFRLAQLGDAAHIDHVLEEVLYAVVKLEIPLAKNLAKSLSITLR